MFILESALQLCQKFLDFDEFWKRIYIHSNEIQILNFKSIFRSSKELLDKMNMYETYLHMKLVI